ncbi:hypothetical protein G3I59_18250 [Amycolatopsis rubida]|uniref:Acyl-CoA dehydrogenase, C-terminal domain n=1 Tax=Amycolatopsis rubida TaxID=112413 RepID=A0A1I5UQF2_9PSEU|nr:MULTISPECIES: acyl-CoA dehydrogenase family protein [Amycolatopsis]MYW92500.1 hypothetical protein [Amycolatopsis rubida]NEC57487.1 hypothetical protein [Amycolatopsis rubida]OAP26990.1 Acryloyl-CoA reductase (NADH) [Amycolatopsis sp. M39]SFP97534.1 Acyl-CoA dehydrogenase, C-terminal domain [Amycolatopsis rubida]
MSVETRQAASGYSSAYESGIAGAPYAAIEHAVAAESLASHDIDEAMRARAASPVAVLIPGAPGQAVAVGPAEWLLAVGPQLVLYNKDDVTRRPLRSLLDDEELYAVDNGPATGLVVCDEAGCTACALTPARLRSRTAGYLCGLAQGAVDAAVRRVQDRVQFDRPIGSNQTVAFQLAALTARLAAVHALGEHVSARIESGQAEADPAGEASRLLAASAELAVEASAAGLHLHGAFGLRSDQDAQRRYRKACAFSVRHGTAARLRQAGSTRREGSR